MGCRTGLGSSEKKTAVCWEVNSAHPASSLVAILTGLFHITESNTEFLQGMQNGMLRTDIMDTLYSSCHFFALLKAAGGHVCKSLKYRMYVGHPTLL
jgi:hypothetical protein